MASFFEAPAPPPRRRYTYEAWAMSFTDDFAIFPCFYGTISQ